MESNLNQRLPMNRFLLLAVAVAIANFSDRAVASTVGDCLSTTGYAFLGVRSSGVNIGSSNVEMFGPADVVGCTPREASSDIGNIQGSADANVTGGVGALTGTGAIAFPGPTPRIEGFTHIWQYYRFRIDAPGLGPSDFTDITLLMQIDYGIVVNESANGGIAGNRLDFSFGVRLASGSAPSFPVSFSHFDAAPTENTTLLLMDTLTVRANTDLDLAMNVLGNSFADGTIGCCGAPPGDGAASMVALVTFLIVPEAGETVLYDYQTALGLPGPSLGALVTTIPLPAGIWLFASGVVILVRRRAGCH